MQIRKPKQINIQQIKNSDGKILTEEKDIMKRWKEHFEELLSTPSNYNKKNDPETETNTTTQDYKIEESINEREVKEALRKLKRGRAAGHDAITPEMLKQMSEKGMETLLELLNAVWNQGIIPTDWEVGVILPIYKKGDSRDCANYRGITLLSVVAKLYEDILNKRLKDILETQLDEAQCGFRKGRSVHDQIFIVKQIIEKTNKQNKNAYLTFIDLEKAFDRVNRNKIWSSLQKRQVTPKLLRAIKSMYKNNVNYVRTNNMDSTQFTTENGLRQGGVLSPTLFNVQMDDIIKAVRAKTNKKLHVGYHKLQPIQISECAFADDLMISAGNVKDLQSNLKIWNDTLKEHNMKINNNKTKVMHIGKKDANIHIRIEGQLIEQVTHYKYLGVEIDRRGSEEIEIQARIQNTSKLYNMLKHVIIGKKEVSRKTKMTVYKTIYRPTLTYGSESWTLNEAQKSKIQAMEMRYLRKVKGVTRMDKIRNDIIREELGIESIMQKLDEQKLRWFGHLSRMMDNRPTKIIWESKTQKRASRGRPKRMWNDEIARILTKRETTWDEARRMAQNKKTWRDFVYKQT